MALTQAQYRAHVLAGVKFSILDRPQRFLELLPGLVEYVQAGGTAPERADRREAVEMMTTAVWNSLNQGAFNGHRAKHLVAESGVPHAVVQALGDLVERAEP